jgi:outer membrane protein assembly factor BamD
LVNVALWLAAAAAVVAGCGAGTQRPTGPVTFGQTAQVNYDRGVAELEGKSLDRARRYFKHVRREFPYSRFATLAELRLADCDFSEESYAEAAASYRRFVRLHPTNEEADHAAFRRGLAFHKMIPTDWFLVPPSYERDMSATRDALRELRAFARQYPQSELVDEAATLVTDCLDRLARHEMYVARFYLRRNKNEAAIGRTRVVEERYAESSLVPEAMFVRAETYMNMEALDDARRTFHEIASRYPGSAEAGRAREYLRHLGAGAGAQAVAGDQDSDVGDGDAPQR